MRWVIAVLIITLAGVIAAASGTRPDGLKCDGALNGDGWVLSVERITVYDPAVEIIQTGARLKCVYQRNSAVPSAAFDCVYSLIDPAGNAWSITSMGLDANGRVVCQYTYPAPVTAFRSAR